MADEKKDYQQAADRILAKLPKAVREKTELEDGGGAYTLLKYGGRTVASIRGKNVRVTFGHDGTASTLDDLVSHIADAATSRPAVKTPEEREAEREAKKKAKEEEKAAKQKAEEGVAAAKAEEEAKAAEGGDD